uniref:RING-type domain-containing protein n=1 Tax=Sciurus vulgaris TaxID=55149 RepID=A0A8D2BDK8_SCIVU
MVGGFRKRLLEVEIICPVCLELIFNPIFLSCSHIFCFDCIRDWLTIRGDLVLTCPLCRRENKTPVMEELHVGALTLLMPVGSWTVKTEFKRVQRRKTQ